MLTHSKKQTEIPQKTADFILFLIYVASDHKFKCESFKAQKKIFFMPNIFYENVLSPM